MIFNGSQSHGVASGRFKELFLSVSSARRALKIRKFLCAFCDTRTRFQEKV